MKVGIKKGMREFAEKQIKNRLTKMTKKEAKEFMKDLEDILNTLDSSWWEICLEFIPVAGDIYGAGKLAVKVRKAYSRLQDLENKMVGKIAKRLKGKNRKKFMNNKRSQGVGDAKKDIDAKNIHTGSKDSYKGKQGHHGDNVATTPERASDPRNIDFQTPEEHLKSHGGDWKNPTKSKGDIHRN